MKPCMRMAVIDGVPQIGFPRTLVYGAEAVVTQVAIRLWTIRGTWTEDTALGLPLLSWAMPSVSDVEVEHFVRRQIGAVPGVLRILEVTARRVTTTLSITVRIEVTDGSGRRFVAGVGDPDQLGIWQGYAVGSWYTIVQIGHQSIVHGGLA